MINWFRKLSATISRDPVDHPEIARMSQRELADLPLVPPMSFARQAAEQMARDSQRRAATSCEDAQGYCAP